MTNIVSVNKLVPLNNRNNIPPEKAKMKFASGPAAATFIISVRGSFKDLGSTGTGFAQPNPTKRIIIEPMGSRCAMGFNVSRPIRAAVLSPRRNATQA